MSGSFMRLINHLFLHRASVETSDFQSDTLWGYVAALCFFIVAMIIAIAWTLFENRKAHPVLFRYVYTIARYYLAFVLFEYGIVKVFGNQFMPNSQNALLYSLPDLSAHQLFWSFMGTSKSYQIFAGLLEIIPASLLLFRRTTIIGSLIAFSVILNVLMLNIGYDTRLKLFLLHLLMITIFLLLPDLKKLYTLFVLRQKDSLTPVYSIIENKEPKWLYRLLRLVIILCIAFLEVKMQINQTNQTTEAPQSEIVGLHTIHDFSLHETSFTKPGQTSQWKKIAVTPFARFSVLLTNDSIATYFFKSFPTSKSFELVSYEDTTFSCKLQYNKINNSEWLFTGIIKNDSVHFISKVIDLNKSMLLKDYGKVKWVY